MNKYMWPSAGGQHKFPKEPLRTVSEMAKVFKVSTSALSSLMWRNDAPRPVLNGENNLGRKKYYSPASLTKWWKSLPNELKATAGAEKRS